MVNMNKSDKIYTQNWIVKFMLDICDYFPDRDLSKLRVVEPSCGTGNFAIEIVSRLCKSASKHGRTYLELINSLKFYDIDHRALDVARKKIQSLLQKYGYSVEESNLLVSSWIVESDFIFSNLAEVDLVIGNPPYIKGVEIPSDLRNKYIEELETYSKGADIYIGFLEKGLKLLSGTGKLCYICSDRWQKNQFGARFRNFVEASDFHISFNCQLHESEVFEQKVTAYPSITLFQRDTGIEKEVICNREFDKVSSKTLLLDLANGANNFDGRPYTIFPISKSEKYRDFPSIEEEEIRIGIGIATGRDKIFITQDPLIVEKELLLPLAHSRDLNSAKFPEIPNRWLINPWKDGNLVNLDDYPKMSSYLLANQEELMNRHVAKRNPKSWYRTIDKVKDDLLSREKLLLRDLTTALEPIYDEGVLYPHHNLYWMTSEKWNLKVLGGILVSDDVTEQMTDLSVKMRGGVIRNQAQYLRKIKVPKFEEISAQDRKMLSYAFETRNRTLASKICNKIYKN